MMRPVGACLRLLLGIATHALLALPVATAQEAAENDREAAERLWANFLTSYRGKSLDPLDPDSLDLKAREVLLATSGPRFSSLKPDSAESLPELADAMLARDPSIGKFARIEQTLEALLPKIDIYGSYNPAADVVQMREALRQNSGIIQMTLEQQPDGRVLCFPTDGGPADKAGVNSGALLMSVDDRPSTGKSLLALRLAFVGPPNTGMKVKVRQPQGKIEEFTIQRTDKRVPDVAVTKSLVGVAVRIRSFSQGSAADLKQQLKAYPKPTNITLDLRGNTGGLREEALKIASLFFPEGTTLGKFTTLGGVQAPKDGNPVFVDPESIRILQDGRTASAAEYLIATLKEGLPGKVTTFGSRSYGKSHTVRQIPLQGGGELTVTESLMSTPQGRSWDKTGLAPDQPGK